MIEFSGDSDYLIIPYDDSWDIFGSSDDFTISFWIKE